jgi:hypothetical protein
MVKSGGRYGGIPSSRLPTNPGTSSSKGAALPTGSYGAVGPRVQPNSGMSIGRGAATMGGPKGVPSGMPRGTPRGPAAGGGENSLGNPRGMDQGGTMPPSRTSGSDVANRKNEVQRTHSQVIQGPAKGYGPRG